jgi:hypothetical protein
MMAPASTATTMATCIQIQNGDMRGHRSLPPMAPQRDLRSRVTIAVLLCLSLGLTACGASKKQLSPAEFVARGDAICRGQNAREKTVPRPTFDPTRAKQSDLHSAATYLDQDVPIFTQTAQRFHDLGLPKGGGDRYRRLFGVLDQLVKANEDARAAADRGDLGAFKAAFAQVARPSAESSALLQQLGFTVCGRA